MSDIYTLRARLAEEQARNRELHGYLNELSAGVSSAHSRMSSYQDKVRQTLTESDNRISTSHNNIIKAHEIQAQIDQLYVLFKHMESANKKIRECNNKIYYEFENYNAVRKIVQGMLDNLNLHMVSDAVIYKSIEKQHLKTPDYWLTSVLISIMAWKNDDKALADRAMEISMNLDKKNTSIFYMLFNIRMNREEAALKWFRVYQECEIKGSDQKTFLMLFSLVNKTMQDDIDGRIKQEVASYIKQMIAKNAQSDGYEEDELTEMIKNSLIHMRGEAPLELTMLNRSLTDYSDLAYIASLAQNNVNILQFVMDVGNVNVLEKNSYLDRFIMDEINKPNDVEAAVYDEIEYNELIIKCKGNKANADEIYEHLKETRKNDLNLIKEMLQWIYEPNSEFVDCQMRKNFFTLTKHLQKKAVDKYVNFYRSKISSRHPIHLGDYSTEADFNDYNTEVNKIAAFYEEQKNYQLKDLKYILAIIGAVLAVAGVGLTVYLANPLCLISCAFALIMIIYNIIGNNVRKKHILETYQLNVNSKSELLGQLFQEYQVYFNYLKENDAYYDQIMDAIDQV